MKKLKYLSEQIKEGIDRLINSETEKKPTLEMTILDMKNRINIAKGIIGNAIAELEILKHAYNDAINAQENWQKIVDSAITVDNSKKADEARQKLHQHQEHVNKVEKQIRLQETVISELKTILMSYHLQFKAASERAESLKQQQYQARLQTEFYQLFAESDNSDESQAFKQAEIRLKKTEDEVEMWKERSHISTEKAEKNRKLFNVDEALNALKNEILGSNNND